MTLPVIPSGYPIKSITINATITEKEYDDDGFNAIIGMVDNNLDLSSASAIFNSTSTEITRFNYRNSISYDMLSFLTEEHKQAGYFILKATAQHHSGNSMAKISITIDLEYYVPMPITIDNNFEDNTGNGTHGSVHISDYAEDKTAPFQINKIVGDNVLLTAVSNQTNNQNHQMIWHEGSINHSEWRKNFTVYIGNLQTYPLNVIESDNNANYQAQLRKNFKIDRVNQTEGDGNITGTSYIVDGYTDQISTYGNGYQPGSISYNFVYWTDNLSTVTTRNITPTDNQTYTALYKASRKSNQTNAYSNTSQRRFVETFNPNLNLKTLHIVYESMGHVWYETSINDGVTWSIMNNGRPLDIGGGRLPSMDYHYQNSSNSQMNEIIIVWQENLNGWAGIKIATFYHDGSSIYSPFVKLYEGFVLGPDQIEYVKPFSENCNPVVGWTDQDVESQALVLWQGTYDDIFGKIEGLVYKIGRISGSGATWDINTPTHLSTQNFSTNINSVNPTITNYKESYYGYNWHIAWEQIINSSTSQIKYSRLDWNILNNQLTIGSIEEASLNSGYSKNYNPVIVIKKIGTSEYIYVTWLGNRTSPTTETKVLLKYKLGTNWSTTGVYGTSPVQNFSINKGTTITNNQEPLALCWSEPNGSSFSNKLKKAPGSTSILTLNSTGKDIQINNGTTFSSMFANSFSSASLPYSFNLSQNFGSINKENSMQIFNGREGVVDKNGAQFFFALGDISVNGQNINFISVPDTVSVNSLPSLNTYFESEPFTVNSSSNLIYGVQYGITDSVLCSSALSDNEQINFKVELIDNQTNEILGSFDEVTYTKQNVYQYNNIGYQVNLSGIGNRTVKFRLVTNTNAEFGYSLSNITADQNILAKGNYQVVNYQCNLTVTEYSLEQNYPNPFNPSTTIKFQLPTDGFVTLKVYDILGNEVTTLINEQKPQGRYEVNFNASSLASGVYIYKIQTGSFISSKKMMLIK